MTQPIGRKPASSAARTQLRQPFQVHLLGGALLRWAYGLSFVENGRNPSMRIYTLTLRITLNDLTNKLHDKFLLTREKRRTVSDCFPKVVTFEASSHDRAFTLLAERIQREVKNKLVING